MLGVYTMAHVPSPLRAAPPRELETRGRETFSSGGRSQLTRCQKLLSFIVGSCGVGLRL